MAAEAGFKTEWGNSSGVRSVCNVKGEKSFHFIGTIFSSTKLEITRRLLGLFAVCKVLFSQNHRMVEAGSDLWRSPDPTSLLKQGHLGLAGADCQGPGHRINHRMVWVERRL